LKTMLAHTGVVFPVQAKHNNVEVIQPVTVEVAQVASSPITPGSPSTPSSADDYDSFINPLSVDSSDDTSSEMLLYMDNGMDLPISISQGEVYSEMSKWEVPNMFTTGLCLLAILFSFGLFFNNLPGLVDPTKGIHLNTLSGRPHTARNLFETNTDEDIYEYGENLGVKYRLLSDEFNASTKDTIKYFDSATFNVAGNAEPQDMNPQINPLNPLNDQILE